MIDIRNIGLVGGDRAASRSPARRASARFDVFLDCFERGVLIRTTGDIIALSPPLIVEKSHIDQAISTHRRRAEDDRLRPSSTSHPAAQAAGCGRRRRLRPGDARPRMSARELDNRGLCAVLAR